MARKCEVKTADYRQQTTNEEQRSTLHFKKIPDALVLTCNRRTAIQIVITREAYVQA